MQCVKIFSPTTWRPLTTSAHSSTPLVSYSYRLYHGSTAIQRSHHHPHGDWPLFQGLSFDSSAQTAYSSRNYRILMRPRFQILWSGWRYSLQSGTTIHLPSLVCLLSKAQHQCQPHIRLPSSSQRSSGTSKPRAHPFPYCHRNQADWSCYLIWAEYAQNSLRKPATGLTPFQCVLGFQPPLFSWSGEPSNLPAINSWLQRIERISNGQSGEQGSRLIIDGVPIPTTIRVNGSGYRPVINVLPALQKTQSQVCGSLQNSQANNSGFV